MVKLRYSFLAILFVFATLTHVVNAQSRRNVMSKKDSLLNEISNVDKRLKAFMKKDTISGYFFRNIDSLYLDRQIVDTSPRDDRGLLIIAHNWQPFDDDMSFADTVICDPAYLPIIFDGKILPNDLSFIRREAPTAFSKYRFKLIDQDSTFAPNLRLADRIAERRRSYYLNNPEKVRFNALTFKSSPPVREQLVEKKNIFEELLSTDDAIGLIQPEVEKIEIKKVYWQKFGEHTLQLSQISYSETWKGDEVDNLYNVKSQQKMTLIYKKDKISLENIIDWRLDVQSAPSDTVHRYFLQNDLLKINTAFGIKAFEKWEYNINGEISSPLFNSYPKNNKKRKTAFSSPLNITMGLGMRYNLEKKSDKVKYRNIKLSLDLSPFSMSYVWVADEGVDASKYGVENGQRSKTKFGSNVNANLAYNFNRYTTLTSRFKYFTSYENVTVESESRLNYALNRYFSTSLFLYLRYDDNIAPAKKDPKLGYFNYNHALSFGLNYKW